MSNTKKIILIIIDGFGLSKKKFGNAIALAKKPTLVMLFKTFPNTTLKASGKLVGLPSEQMGNSEVGHLNIGAGRIIYTGLSLINNEIKTNKFQKNKSFVDAITHVKKNHSKLHIIGLCSEGGVHSSLQHIFELMKISKKENINSVLHIISDGRDVKQKQMREDIKEIERVSNETNTKIGSISGRFYAMDRDCR
jgi:2,3-bisphosphoglycerate-independent phosphoglycerate mutase